MLSSTLPGRSQVTTLAEHVLFLQRTAVDLLSRRKRTPPLVISAALDGQFASVLRADVALPERRAAGAFPTSSLLADRLVESYPVTEHSHFLDPACGGGDLLLAVTRLLPVEDTLEATLRVWGERLGGRDIDPEFVKAAKARLVIAAVSRFDSHGTTRGWPTDLSDLFPNILVGDSLVDPIVVSSDTLVLLNPPFGYVEIPRGELPWAAGRTARAAVFLERVLEDAAAGSSVAAILPDVLRAGSRYRRWRRHIEDVAVVELVEPIGRFDAWTDVDVFFLRLRMRGEESSIANEPVVRWWSAGPATESVGDHFAVSVGAVVPHRDKNQGQWCRYLDVGQLPAWGTTDSSNLRKRRFRGTVVRPPFVAVRRTSSPNDPARAVGTLVTGLEEVAVENHILILKPTGTGAVSDCRRLLDELALPGTSDWLNDRIRCRHLTVVSLREIPWGASDG